MLHLTVPAQMHVRDFEAANAEKWETDYDVYNT